MSNIKIGIIGINGKYGTWLHRYFTDWGYQVIGSDITLQLAKSSREVVEQSDIVVVAVPISSTVKVIQSIVPFVRSDQLLIDITGVKEAPVKAMLESKAQVVGLHPMCAPTILSWRGQILVVCEARLTDHWKEWFQNQFLPRTKAKIKRCTPEEHDRYVAVVQAASHAVSLAFAAMMRSQHISIAETLEFTSPTYRIFLA